MDKGCDHTPVYAGVVNLRLDGEPVGFIDVWRCTKCGMLFAEERRYPPREDYSLGFNEPRGVLSLAVCSTGGGYEWALVDAAPGVITKCGECEVSISEGPRASSNACDVSILPLGDILNRNVELREVSSHR
ncbi:MAG: hypothetical protein ACP5RJ_05360 [Conexivisphaera sp.]